MGLVLNFSPIQFDDREISAGWLPYGDNGEQVLSQLREEQGHTHVFRREGANSIWSVGLVADAPIVGEPKTIRLKEHLGLAAALIRNTLLNYLTGLDRILLTDDPIRFLARENLLQGIVPEHIPCPDWLRVHLKFELAVRPISFLERESFVAAILDVGTADVVERTAAQVIDDGLCIDGLYVGRRLVSRDSRIAPRFKLAGRVDSINGNEIRLADSRDGTETIEADHAWLDRRAFRTCLSHVFKQRAAEINSALRVLRPSVRQGKALHERITNALDFLRKQQYEVIPGLPFLLGPMLDNSMPGFPKLEPALAPVYVFDANRRKTSSGRDGGLNKHGPYTARLFTRSGPRICVVCEQSNEEEVKRFLHRFVHGLKLTSQPGKYGSTPPRNYFEKGFSRKYSVPEPVFELFAAVGDSAESYKDACERAIEKHGTGHKYDLALVQIEDRFRQLPPYDNPYFISKACFYTHQILVQEFRIETMLKVGTELSACLNNMSLATYAKLNGIPWLLQMHRTDAHELVIGLGSAEVREGRLGQRERVVGITTVFSGDGDYYLSNVSKAVRIDKYWSAVLESLEDAMVRVRAGINWKAGDRVRLVFHIKFKYFNRSEMESLKDVIKKFCDFTVEYAFLHVSDEHPYILFDTSQPGIVEPGTDLAKGQYAPQRGNYLVLGDRDVLISLTGPGGVKRAEHGLPRPVLLSLDRNSTFTEMEYLTSQVFGFAGHSWRSFFPGSLPVTIQYSNLIASSLGKLSRLPDWNASVMLGPIGRTRWFL